MAARAAGARSRSCWSACTRWCRASCSASPTRRPASTRPTHFNGVDNYARLLDNDLFWKSFRIGLIWAFGVTILQFLASLGLALLLNLDLRLRWLARTLALVPWAMPPVVIAIMWKMMLNPTYGPVNEIMRSLGLPGDINWLGDFSTALPAVIVVGVWAGMPQTTITLLAGLQNVSARPARGGRDRRRRRVAAVLARDAARAAAR